MKIAICYYSRHHGNTRKVLEALAGEGEAYLFDVTTRQAVRLEGYDRIGFASGVYYGKFHPSVPAFARQYLPEGKPVFFLCTYGASRGKSLREMEAVAREKYCPSCASEKRQGSLTLIGCCMQSILCPSRKSASGSGTDDRALPAKL